MQLAGWFNPGGRSGPGLESVDQIDDIEEAAAGTVADGGSDNGDSHMRHARATDQDDVALISHVCAPSPIGNQIRTYS